MSDLILTILVTCGIIVVILCLIRRSRNNELRAWNNGACSECGCTWHVSSGAAWDWEGQYRWFECRNGHKIGMHLLTRTAAPLPGPDAAALRTQLNQTLSVWRQPGRAGVRLDLIQRARLIIAAMHDDDIPGLQLQHEDDDVIRIYRTRADDVFEEIKLHKFSSYYRYEGSTGCDGVEIDANLCAEAIAALLGSDLRNQLAKSTADS